MGDSAQRWIEAGYELFANEGPEGLQVEKLAKKLGLNKSGFYHHFGDREVFISKVLDYHCLQAEKVRTDISSLLKFDPDYYDLLQKHRTLLFVQMQLRRHPDQKHFQQVFHNIVAMNDKALAPLLSAHLGIPGDHDLALELWDLVRDSFYIQLTRDNLSMALPRRIVELARKIIFKLQQKNNRS
ncbi:MAG: TetR/AcrR family transcriptional regulator [Bacteroidales bacterium]|jgi:AcrR family transcriptional regulator|nr:TetR/AcrR family transcriptional regulator [Bacteroidales bacterium]